MTAGRPGVLLDLDGTLIDTAPDLIAAVNRLRADRDQAPMPVARLRAQASWGARGMLAQALNLYPGDADYAQAHQRFMALYRERLSAEAQPFPGMRGALTELAARGYIWGVVSNKLEDMAVPLMAAMVFAPPPACVIGGDTAGVAKPDPAPLLLGCERAGIAPQTTIYVGDSARDIEAGRAAGMRTIAVSYGYFEPDEDLAAWGADLWIDHASELPAAVEQLLSPGMVTKLG